MTPAVASAIAFGLFVLLFLFYKMWKTYTVFTEAFRNYMYRNNGLQYRERLLDARASLEMAVTVTFMWLAFLLGAALLTLGTR